MVLVGHKEVPLRPWTHASSEIASADDHHGAARKREYSLNGKVVQTSSLSIYHLRS